MTAPQTVEYALMVDWGEESSPRYEYVPAQNHVHAAQMARTIYSSRPARVVAREVEPWRYVTRTPAASLGAAVSV